MGLETATYIADLVATNPTSTDPKSQSRPIILAFRLS